MTSTHDTRHCGALAAVVVALAMMFAPALTPAALAYDAKASGAADSARLILPDWDALDGGIDPFDRSLIPRRAMEHPHEWYDVAVAGLLWGCSYTVLGSGICGGLGFGYAVARHCAGGACSTSDPDVCSMAANDPMASVDGC